MSEKGMPASRTRQQVQQETKIIQLQRQERQAIPASKNLSPEEEEKRRLAQAELDLRFYLDVSWVSEVW